MVRPAGTTTVRGERNGIRTHDLHNATVAHLQLGDQPSAAPLRAALLSSSYSSAPPIRLRFGWVAQAARSLVLVTAGATARPLIRPRRRAFAQDLSLPTVTPIPLQSLAASPALPATPALTAMPTLTSLPAPPNPLPFMLSRSRLPAEPRRTTSRRLQRTCPEPVEAARRPIPIAAIPLGKYLLYPSHFSALTPFPFLTPVIPASAAATQRHNQSQRTKATPRNPSRPNAPNLPLFSHLSLLSAHSFLIRHPVFVAQAACSLGPSTSINPRHPVHARPRAHLPPPSRRLQPGPSAIINPSAPRPPLAPTGTNGSQPPPLLSPLTPLSSLLPHPSSRRLQPGPSSNQPALLHPGHPSQSSLTKCSQPPRPTLTPLRSPLSPSASHSSPLCPLPFQLPPLPLVSS